MLDHIGEPDAARRIQTALEAVLVKGPFLTGDLDGTASTNEFTDAIIAALPH